MKNFLTNLMTSVALLCTLSGGLKAQSFYRVSATVPFEWKVDSRHLDAGNYEITRDVASPVISLRNTEDGKVTFLMTIRESAADALPRMVFHRYGDQYFLAEIWVGSDGRKLPVSGAEKEEIASGKPLEVATVLVDIVPAKHS